MGTGVMQGGMEGGHMMGGGAQGGMPLCGMFLNTGKEGFSLPPLSSAKVRPAEPSALSQSANVGGIKTGGVIEKEVKKYRWRPGLAGPRLANVIAKLNTQFHERFPPGLHPAKEWKESPFWARAAAEFNCTDDVGLDQVHPLVQRQKTDDFANIDPSLYGNPVFQMDAAGLASKFDEIRGQVCV